LKFDDPREIAGRGTFGWVVKAEYRGTTVAVKRDIPSKERVNRNARFLPGEIPNTNFGTGHFGDQRPIRAVSFEEPQSITAAFFGDPRPITVTTPITDAKILWTT